MLIWTLFGGIIATSSVCHVDMIIRSGPLGNWASLKHAPLNKYWPTKAPSKLAKTVLSVCNYQTTEKCV